MNRTGLLLGTFLCLGVPGSLLFAQGIKDISGSGAVLASGEHMRVIGTVGQTTIGMLYSPGSVAQLGFWNTLGSRVSAVPLQGAGAQNHGTALNLSVHPNPVSDRTAFGFTMPDRGTASLLLYNNLGQQVRVIAESEFNAGQTTLEYHLKDLPAGRYTAVLQTGELREAVPLHIVE